MQHPCGFLHPFQPVVLPWYLWYQKASSSFLLEEKFYQAIWLQAWYAIIGTFNLSSSISIVTMRWKSSVLYFVPFFFFWFFGSWGFIWYLEIPFSHYRQQGYYIHWVSFRASTRLLFMVMVQLAHLLYSFLLRFYLCCACDKLLLVAS